MKLVTTPNTSSNNEDMSISTHTPKDLLTSFISHPDPLSLTFNNVTDLNDFFKLIFINTNHFYTSAKLIIPLMNLASGKVLNALKPQLLNFFIGQKMLMNIPDNKGKYLILKSKEKPKGNFFIAMDHELIALLYVMTRMEPINYNAVMGPKDHKKIKDKIKKTKIFSKDMDFRLTALKYLKTKIIIIGSIIGEEL